MTQFSDLLGLTLVSVVKSDDDDRITLTTADNRMFVQQHYQDCCESVYVEEIHGDLADLLGSPILLAEEVIHDNEPDENGKTGSDEDYRWTFYKLATAKGHVTIRWLGESNGYYSTSVSFTEESTNA